MTTTSLHTYIAAAAKQHLAVSSFTPSKSVSIRSLMPPKNKSKVETATPRPARWRFRLGDRVLAKIDEDSWKPGTISQVEYQEEGWDSDRFVPYQILIDPETSKEEQNYSDEDNRVYVFAPRDHDDVVRAMEKRFKVGDRVLARMDNDDWRTGTVSKLDYREDGWHPHRVAPYQILLDSKCRFDKTYVFAPADNSFSVRSVPEFARDMRAPYLRLGKSGEWIVVDAERGCRNCLDEGELCSHHHVCKDGIRCPLYHFCGSLGRTKTRLLKKLERKKKQSQLEASKMCPNCNCPHEASTWSLDDVIDFVEGEKAREGGSSAGGKTNKRRRKRKKKKKKGRRKSRETFRDPCTHMKRDCKVQDGQKATTKRCVAPFQVQAGFMPCECECHKIAQKGRQAVIEKLREGMDFEPLFKEEFFVQHSDPHEVEELEAFKSSLQILPVHKSCGQKQTMDER